MPRIIRYLVDKINPEPSVFEMKEFGLRYTKEEWVIICNNKYFLNAFDKDLMDARKIADKELLLYRTSRNLDIPISRE